jgi:exonuclease SbcC
MKICSLHLSNFTKYGNFTADFPTTINVIVARNAEGKTSIIDAITYALAGRCARTDAAGRGAEAMIRTGARDAQIGLTVSMNGSDYDMTRTIPGGLHIDGLESSQKNLQEYLYEAVGAEQGAVLAALNTSSFLGLRPDDQKSLLFSLLGLSFEAEDLKRQIAKEVPLDLEAQTLQMLDAVPLKLFDGTGRTYENLYKHFYELRRNWKRRLKELGSVEIPREGDMPAREEVEAKLETLRKEHSEKVDIKQEWQATRTRRAELEAELEDVQDSLGKAGPPAADMEKIRGKAQELRAQAKAKTEESVGLMRAAESLAAAGAERTCPLAPGIVTCPLGKAKRDTLVSEIEKRSMDLDAEIIKVDGKAADLERKLEIAGPDRANLEGRADRIKEELDDLPEVEISKGLSDEIETLQERLDKGRAVLEEILRAEGARQAMEAVGEERARLSADIGLLERLVELTSPKGIPGRLLSETIGPLEKMANERLSLLTGGRYELGFLVDPDFRIVVTHDGAESDLSRLSSSERMRIGVILQDAVSRLSGLRVMMIDDAEVLDPDNRALLINTLVSIKDDYDTILVMSTLGPKGIENPHLEDLSVFQISDGLLQEVE